MILMAEVFSLLKIKGLEKLKDEMSEWVSSQSISCSGFMTKPADLQQQLYAQREIAIRELSNVKNTLTPTQSDKNDNDKFFDARLGCHK